MREMVREGELQKEGGGGGEGGGGVKLNAWKAWFGFFLIFGVCV